MDFTAALSYPFKSIAKVATIVLVITIAIAVFLGMLLNSFDWAGFISALEYSIKYETDRISYDGNPTGMFIPALLGLFLVMLVQGFWLSGYGIRIIRHVIDGHEKLPAVQLGKDVVNGLALFGSSIVYGLLFIPFIIIVGMLMGMTSTNGSGGLSFLVMCSSFLIAIPLMILIGWAYFVGMARCAIDDNRGALFQIGTNIKIARNNVRASFSLTGYLILLGLAYWFISQFASNVLQLFMTPAMNGIEDQIGILIAIVVSIMMWLALNIVQEFSKMHLIAQYAHQIALYDDFDTFNPKNDDFDFDFD